jgi:hypothetical protein
VLLGRAGDGLVAALDELLGDLGSRITSAIGIAHVRRISIGVPAGHAGPRRSSRRRPQPASWKVGTSGTLRIAMVAGQAIARTLPSRM